MEKYLIIITHHPKTKIKLLEQEIWARDFEDAHTFAISWCEQMKLYYSHHLFYEVKESN